MCASIGSQTGESKRDDGLVGGSIFRIENCDFMREFDEIGVLECNITKRLKI